MKPFGLILTLVLTVAAFTSITTAADDDTRIVFVAGSPSHAPGDHEHRAGSMLLAKTINENVPDAEAVVTFYGWPKDESIFDGADTVVMYCDGGRGHMANRHRDKVKELMDAGVGLVCLHYAVEYPPGEIGDAFKQWLGGYFETHWSVNPHWDAEFESLPDHPIANGVKPFTVRDEWYFNMRFMPDMKGVTPILSAVPPMSTMDRDDGPHSGNPHVRKMVEAREPQHVAWAYERSGSNGRSFGYTGGHFHRNWKHDDIRKLVVNAILWTAHRDIPGDGFGSPTPSDEDMKANLDDKGRR